jgi:hypothetical protein
MADAVAVQTIVSGTRNAVVKMTSLSDGTGESAVKKIDMSDLGASSLKVTKIHYSVTGMVATLLWDADADVRMVDLAGDGCFDFSKFGGLINNAGTGVTGDINLTTTGHTNGDSYTIVLEMAKD